MESDMSEQTPADEPIAPQEPSEAVTEPTETAADPFAGSWQPNAAIVEGVWAGFVNYLCSACQYASLNEAKTQAHVSTHGQTFTEGA